MHLDLDNLENVVDKTVDTTATEGLVNAQATSLEAIYDAEKMLLLAVDTSGSMDEKMYTGTGHAEFQWDEREHTKHIASRIALAKFRRDYPTFDLHSYFSWGNDHVLPEGVESLGFDEYNWDVARKPAADPIWLALEGRTFREIQDVVLEHFLFGEILVGLGYTTRGTVRVTKENVARKVVAKAIEERFERYSTSNVRLVEFDTEATVCPFTDQNRLLNHIRNHSWGHGGTKILDALKKCLDIISRKPSPVNLHHIVLVTDGIDETSRDALSLLPAFKAKGVVLDLNILQSPSTFNEPLAEELLQLVAAVGGTVQYIRSASEFEKKYLAAASRLCLPAPTV